MADRFFQCVCGKMASVDMFLLTMQNELIIACRCGRSLSPKDASLLGFGLLSAHYAWARYMKEETIRADFKRRNLN